MKKIILNFSLSLAILSPLSLVLSCAQKELKKENQISLNENTDDTSDKDDDEAAKAEALAKLKQETQTKIANLDKFYLIQDKISTSPLVLSKSNVLRAERQKLMSWDLEAFISNLETANLQLNEKSNIEWSAKVDENYLPIKEGIIYDDAREKWFTIEDYKKNNPTDYNYEEKIQDSWVIDIKVPILASQQFNDQEIEYSEFVEIEILGYGLEMPTNAESYFYASSSTDVSFRQNDPLQEARDFYPYMWSDITYKSFYRPASSETAGFKTVYLDEIENFDYLDSNDTVFYSNIIASQSDLNNYFVWPGDEQDIDAIMGLSGLHMTDERQILLPGNFHLPENIKLINALAFENLIFPKQLTINSNTLFYPSAFRNATFQEGLVIEKGASFAENIFDEIEGETISYQDAINDPYQYFDYSYLLELDYWNSFKNSHWENEAGDIVSWEQVITRKPEKMFIEYGAYDEPKSSVVVGKQYVFNQTITLVND